MLINTTGLVNRFGGTFIADTDPDQFTFNDVTDRALSSTITSNAITVTGINAVANISITGGSYSIDGGAYTTSAGTISINQQVTLQVATSSNNDTLTSATLTIGTTSDQWDVTTLAAAVASIDSVGSSVTFGDTLNFTTSNLGTITSWTLSDGFNIISLAGTNTTAIVPGLADEVSRILTGLVILTIGDGVSTVNTSGDFTITLNPPSGYSSTKLTAGFVTTEESYLFNYGGTPAIGDDFISLDSEIALDTQGGWITSGPVTSTIYAIDASDGFMESFDLTAAIPSDSVPNPFSFDSQIDVALSGLIESNVITISGINTSAPITADLGEYRINAGTYTSSVGNVFSGDTVQLRQTSSPTNLTLTTQSLLIGGVVGTFDVTTIAAASDTTPDPFNFTNQTGVPVSSNVESNIETITGFNATTTISVDLGEYRVNGGTYTSSAGTIEPNDTVQLRQPSSASNSALTTQTATIGGVVDVWDITTLAASDTTPDPFGFISQIDVSLSTLIESNIVTISGISASTAVIVDIGEYRINGGAYTSSPGSLLNGNTVQLRQTSSDSNLTLLRQVLTVGDVDGSFSVTTEAAIVVPPTFSATETLESSSGVPVANQTLDYILRNTWNGVIVDQGTLTTNSVGLFTITNLNAATGEAWISIRDQADDDIASTFTITVF